MTNIRIWPYPTACFSFRLCLTELSFHPCPSNGGDRQLEAGHRTLGLLLALKVLTHHQWWDGAP